jgi:hypothetical protein
MLKTFSLPGEFWGKRALYPMTDRALRYVFVGIEIFWVETNQVTPSLQGGVVSEPE